MMAHRWLARLTQKLQSRQPRSRHSTGTRAWNRRAAAIPAVINSLEPRQMLAAPVETVETQALDLTVSGNPFVVATGTQLSTAKTGVAEDGRSIMAWLDGQTVKMQTYNAQGTATGSAITVATNTSLFDMAVARDGSTSVVWSNIQTSVSPTEISSSYTITLARYNSQGGLIARTEIDSSNWSRSFETGFASGTQLTGGVVGVNDSGTTVVSWNRYTYGSQTFTIIDPDTEEPFERPAFKADSVLMGYAIGTGGLSGTFTINSAPVTLVAEDRSVAAAMVPTSISFGEGNKFFVGGNTSTLREYWVVRTNPDGTHDFVTELQTGGSAWFRAFEAKVAKSDPILLEEYSGQGKTAGTGAIGFDSDGIALVTWGTGSINPETYQGSSTLKGRHYSQTGSPLDAAFTIASTPVSPTTLNDGITGFSLLDDGSFALSSVANKTAYVREYNADGSPQGPRTPVSQPGSYEVSNAVMGRNADGVGVVIWRQFEPTSPSTPRQILARRVQPAFIKTVTADIDDPANGAATFGTYIEGVSLNVKYTITGRRALVANEQIQYSIDGKGWLTATPTTDPKVFTFTTDVGKLTAGQDTHTLEVRLFDTSTQSEAEKSDSTILTTKDLGLSLKGGAAGGTLFGFDKLRFLDDVSVPTNIETTLSKLPLFDIYKSKFQLVLREIGGTQVDLPKLLDFANQGGVIRPAEPLFLDSTKLNDVRSSATDDENATDYELVLTAREDITKEFGLDAIRVETVPKWLRTATGNITGTYNTNTHKFEFKTSYPSQLNKLFYHETTETPFGLFNGLKTELTAGLNFTVFAGLSIDQEAYAEATDLQAKATLLGKPLVNETKPLPERIKVTADLDETKLTTKTITVKTTKYELAGPTELINVSLGGSDKPFNVKLPDLVLKGLTGPLSNFLSLKGSLNASTGPVQAQGTFVFDVSGNEPRFDEGTTVTFYASATGKGEAGAKFEVGFLGHNVFEAGVNGTLWADVTGILAIDINGKITDPSVTINDEKSLLATQVGYQLDIDWQVLGYGDKATVIQNYGTPKRILGGAPMGPSLRSDNAYTVSGDGIVTETTKPPTPNLNAAMSAPASAPSVSTLRFDAPFNPYSSEVQLDFEVESDAATIPTGAHQFALLAVPTDPTNPTVTLRNVDLSTYSLSSATDGLGYRSAPLRITTQVDSSQFVVGASYRLVLQLTNNSAAGEKVIIRPIDIQITTPEPKMILTAAGNVLADGLINFDTEAGGTGYVDLQIANDALPLLEITDIQVEGAGYGLSPADTTQYIYQGDDPRTLRVQITNPGLAGAGTLRFKTNDPTRPEVVIALKSTASNRPPVVVPRDFLIGENSANGAFIGTIAASDPDVGQTRTFAITAGNTNNAFSIHPTTGVLSVNNTAALNYETITQFNLTVRVSDNGTPALSATAPVRVFLRDVNEAPTLVVKDFLISENTSNGAFIGTFSSSDPDAGQTRTYSITSGNLNNAFAVHPTTGVFTVRNSAALDFEANKHLDLTVTVSDNGTPALSKSAPVRVFLRDVNEAPTVVAQDFLIGENSANGAFITTIASRDPDAGQTRTYSIVSGNTNNAFAIHPTTGVLTVKNTTALDYEKIKQFNLTVQVTDNGNPALSATAPVRGYLRDVNEAPVIIAKDFLIGENSANNAFIGTISATDPDAGQTRQFAITGGNTNNAFAIHPTTGVLTVKNTAALDYETIKQFNLTITVTDNGTPAIATSTVVKIFLRDVNEAPVVVAQDFLINENSAKGAFIGTIVATDPDAGQTRTFAITGGNTNNAFTINPSTGVITINNAAALDFETLSQFNLTITVTDNGSPAKASSAVVRIFLKDVNEPPVIVTQTLTVKTRSTTGTVVGDVVVQNPERNQTLTYAIESGNGLLNNVFSIDASTGRIRVNNALGLLFARTFDLSIRVTDNGSPAQSVVGTVRIVVNETGVTTPLNTPAFSPTVIAHQPI